MGPIRCEGKWTITDGDHIPEVDCKYKKLSRMSAEKMVTQLQGLSTVFGLREHNGTCMDTVLCIFIPFSVKL